MSGTLVLNPCVPTLGATTLLTDPSQILAYVIRQFCTTPQHISTLYYQNVISLGDLISRSGNDANAVAGPAQTALMQVLNAIFGSGAASVSTEINQLTDASYSLVLVVQVVYQGQVYGVTPTVQVTNGVLVLQNDTLPTFSSPSGG